MLLPDPIGLVPFLPQKGQSPDQIGQELGDDLVAERILPVVEECEVGLKGVGGSFEDGVDVGDNRAEVVGLHGMRIKQPDHMRALILLELAELDEQLVVLLRGVRHHLLDDVSILVVGREQLERAELADRSGAEEGI